MSRLVLSVSLFFLLLCSCSTTQKDVNMASKIRMKALIIDGENNHGTWPKTTVMMRDYLNQTGLFEVDVARKAYAWQGPHADEVHGKEGRLAMLEQYKVDGIPETTRVEEPKEDPEFSPDFSQYNVVISNLGWKASEWPQKTKQDFVKYMKSGGGLVVIHAADNSFGDWTEYNEMIGLGGWGGRNTESGPYVYFDDKGKLVHDHSEGGCGSHGPGHEYQVVTRAADHPIMKGIPDAWLHTKDELYDRLRGPAENMTVLATAYSDVEGNAPPWDKTATGTGRHEPALMAINYGDGRVFHSILGHNDYSLECVGFITTFQRGAEWAASGKVTIPVPKDFPSAKSTSKRDWSL